VTTSPTCAATSRRPDQALDARQAAPTHAFEYDLALVLAFVQSRIVGLKHCDGMTAIGLRKDGELVAGAIFEGFNGRNVWVHLAGAPGARWMTRDYLRACFAYAFLVCGVQRLSGYVDASNTQARKLNEHFGYRIEATLAGAAADGGDVLIYMMRREDCRFIPQGARNAVSQH
jgi:RimJ/RimL family protein N-acetyltransferase